MKEMAIKWVLVGIGLCSLALGFAGIFLPLLPTTPFVLLSAWCFYKGSPRLHQWLLDHPLLGPPLIDWQEKGAISRKTKAIAISLLGFSILFIALKAYIIGLKVGLILLLVGVGVFIATRPTGER